jgi:hypothetical protein
VVNQEFQHCSESQLINSSDDSKNAPGLICINREFDSNEIDQSDGHSRKHDESRLSTLLGITRNCEMRRARKVTNQSVINNIKQESFVENNSPMVAFNQTIRQVDIAKANPSID